MLSTTNYDHLPEIRCQCDEGPHGALRITRHASAAPLSVEVRYGGVRILVGPGTYCYYRPQRWRSYFRSMMTLCRTAGAVDENQLFDKGRLLRLRRAHAWEAEIVDHGDVANWTAEHDGYCWLHLPARHRRSVLLDRASRIVDIIDQIDGRSQDIYPAFYLGQEVKAEFAESGAFLSWPGSATPGTARLELPVGLSWSLHGAEAVPIPGGFGYAPAFSLMGRGRCVAGAPLVTRLEFSDTEMLPNVFLFQAVPWSTSGDGRGEENEGKPEAR